MIEGPPEFPATCDACGSRVPFGQIPEERYRRLVDDHYLRYFVDELRMLERVADFYRRNPKAQGRVVSHADRVCDSRDPLVMQQIADGVPFDEIELPPEPKLQLDKRAPGDAEVIEYLKHNSFELAGRTKFVKERVEVLTASVEPVICTRCERGRLHLVEEVVMPTAEQIASWNAERARAKAEYDAGGERRKQEHLDAVAAKDAAITDKRCRFCGKPCPGYRKTCKHCGKSVLGRR